MPSGRSSPSKTRAATRIRVEKSSGNVFEDLSVPGAAEALAKAELATKISDLIAKTGLTQLQAGKLLGIDQADVSDLTRGRFRGFSTDRLFRILRALGQEIEIVVRPARSNKAPAWSLVRERNSSRNV